MLHHVDLQKQGSERLDRRCQSQVDGCQATEEGGGMTAVPAPCVAAAEHQPAAKVNAGADNKRDQEPGVEGPGAQEGVERGAHGYSFSSFRAEAGLAGGSPCGRRFSRNATRAVISAGLICLP